MPERQLQPLRIPKGFKVEWNAFYDYDPSQDFDSQQHETYLREDLLQLKYEAEELVIDLGWYGEPQAKEGYFQLLLLRGLHWDQPLVRITSKSLKEITAKLESLLWKIADRDTS